MGEIFPELAESMRQMNEIISGKRKPSRVFRVEPLRMVGIGWANLAMESANSLAYALGLAGFIAGRPLPRDAARQTFRDGAHVFPASREYWRLFDEAELVLWPSTEPWNDGTPTTVDYDNDCAP